jgi:hypothetical protein
MFQILEVSGNSTKRDGGLKDRRRINSVNACYFSVRKCYRHIYIPKRQDQDKLCKTAILSVALYGCET